MANDYQVSIEYGASESKTSTIKPQPEEYKRFEELMQKLVGVPKTEVKKKPK